MWTQKTKNGKYRAFERYPLPDGSYKTLSVLMDKDNASTRKAALAYLNNESEKLYLKRATLQAVIDEYLTEISYTHREQTIESTRSRFNTILRLFPGDREISAFTAGEIRRVLYRQGQSLTWVDGLISLWKKLLRWSYRADYIKDTRVIDKLASPASAQTERKEKLANKYLTRSELRELLSSIPPQQEQYRLLIEFLALTGMRYGEFAALTPADFTESEIIINKTYSARTGKCNATKTPAGNRTLHIQPELAVCISRINAYSARVRMKHPEARTENVWMPFSRKPIGESDCRIPAYSFNRFLRSQSAKILGKEITAHALRHTHASLLFEQGFSYDEVARRLGHNRSVVTREIYVHITDALKKKDNQHLDSVSLL